MFKVEISITPAGYMKQSSFHFRYAEYPVLFHIWVRILGLENKQFFSDKLLHFQTNKATIKHKVPIARERFLFNDQKQILEKIALLKKEGVYEPI
jgi:hypothetical protein